MYWLLFKYQRSFKVPFARDTVYNRCLKWLNSPSEKLVKQDIITDTANAHLSARLKIKIDSSEYVLHSEFKLNLDCQEKLYRIIIEDFTFSYYDTDILKTIKFKMESEEEWNIVKPYINKISDHLFKYVSSKPNPSK